MDGFVHNPYVNLFITACFRLGLKAVFVFCVFFYGTAQSLISLFTLLPVSFEAQEWTFVSSGFGFLTMRKAIDGSDCDL